METAVVLCCLLAFVQQVRAQTTYNERSLVGGEVILPCDYNQATDGNIIGVTWTLTGGSYANLYIKITGTTGNQATPPAEYAGRLEMVGDVNLKLTGVKLEDERQYKCAVTASVNSETSFINLQVLKQSTVPVVEDQYDPQPADMSSVPLNTTVTFTCTSTEGRPPATLGWTVTENGAPMSVNPTYTSSNNSQGVGDATSTFNFTTTKYGVTYRVQCTASGPDPIQSRTSAITSFTTEKDPSAIPTTPKGQTDSGFSKAPQTGGLSSGAQAGIGVGIALGCIALAGVLAYFFVVTRKKRAGRDKDDGDARDPADRHYENVGNPDQRVASQPPGSGSDDYDYEVPMETIQPSSQPRGDYQELRPAIYQSLQKH